MQVIDLHLFLKYHFPTLLAYFASANHTRGFTISETLGADVLLKFYKFCRSIYDDIVSACKSGEYTVNRSFTDVPLSMKST